MTAHKLTQHVVPVFSKTTNDLALANQRQVVYKIFDLDRVYFGLHFNGFYYFGMNAQKFSR